jgi:hypothetical protein
MSVAPAQATWKWPPDVLDFAARHQIDAYLDPLLETTRKMFPTAVQLRVRVEHDPELRDLSHISFEVHVPQPRKRGCNHLKRHAAEHCLRPLAG